MRLRFRHSPLVLRLASAALALLCVAAPLLGSLHEATESHARCLEHGELLDLAATQTAPPHQPAFTGETPVADEDPAAPHETSHQHCLVVASAAQRALFREPQRLAEASAEVDLAQPIALSLAPTQSLELLHVAPKSSPPRA